MRSTIFIKSHCFLIFIGILAYLSISGCGDDNDDGDTPTATPKVSETLIQGTWSSECFERDGSHVKTIQGFTDKSYSVTSHIYTRGSDCSSGQNSILTVGESGNYQLGEDTGSGNTEIDRTPGSLKVSIINDTGADATKTACAFAANSGISNPQPNSEIELVNDSCLSIFQSPPYNLVKIRDNVMFAGDTETIEAQNGTESGKRPQHIGAALPFMK